MNQTSVLGKCLEPTGSSKLRRQLAAMTLHFLILYDWQTLTDQLRVTNSKQRPVESLLQKDQIRVN